ncbi:pyridoxal phosphate-dependent aminotransferase [Streptomyces sp. NBC_00102]|uniref:pyridoxal phosphate-dependent aminotransferase n=1 Tax=Streptomyces sp. NBC_00102 TaxID=2975652 RepID=UPI002256759F|nr:pyridoxal phosphate-dependent aminotransferase [Streptomyces sp. NBC_00102]MCX5400299.1 pyridoxal phosphate-dependent aminotransferase [Streptomyces sp. NBC_00102]
MESVSEASSIRTNNRIYELRAAGLDIVTLSLGEAFFDLPTPSFEGMPGTQIHHYSHSRGVPLLRQKLAGYYETCSGAPVDPETEIMVTAGSKAAIFMTLTAMLDPGDEVIIPEPLWVSYPDQVRLARGVPVMTPWYEQVGDLESYITPRTRAIIVNNPHNPSGRRLGAVEMLSLHEMAEKHGLFLISDEAYHEFVPEGEVFVSALEHDPEKRHTIVCNSMSKNYGISGWRIGYLIADQHFTRQVIKLQQHMVTCAPTILSYYLAENFEAILDHTRPQIRRVVATRNRMAGLLADRGVQCLPGDATFYLFASLGESRLDSTEFAERLLTRYGVAVVPGAGYGASCDRFVRVAVGAETEDRLVRGMHALADLVEATR